MRPVSVIGIAVLVMLAAATGVIVHAHDRCSRWEGSSSDTAALVSVLGLSDLALSTEARYIRHLSLSDVFSAFQDAPCGLDFLPSGSFYPPPAHVGLPGGRIGE